MTKTLTKISEIGRVDFNLLDRQEQDTAIADLEHLLITPFPDNELPAPTRVSFAATKIAFLAAEREEPVFRLVELERDLLHQQRRLEQILHLVRRSRHGSTSGAQLHKDRLTTESEMKSLSRQIRQIERKLASRTRSSNARTFSLLLKAVREYPEKLRLWERALQFCRLVGYQQLDPIMEELRRGIKNNPLSGSLLRARLLQILATQLFRCTQTIVADDHIYSRRVAARDYLIAALKHLPLRTSREEKYYEQVSRLVCEAAAGAALDILRSDDTERFIAGVHLARIRKSSD